MDAINVTNPGTSISFTATSAVAAIPAVGAGGVMQIRPLDAA